MFTGTTDASKWSFIDKCCSTATLALEFLGLWPEVGRFQRVKKQYSSRIPQKTSATNKQSPWALLSFPDEFIESKI